MTVENTNPIQHFTANGETTVFAISFAVEGKDNIKVTVNGSVVSVNDYSYDALTKAVVFNAAPEDGAEVVVERVTSLDRSINYQTYDNSFRPETLNYDLDRIWHVLQEDKITDAEILARIKDEIEWRRTHNTEWDLLAQAREQGLFNALKSYMDTIGAMSVPNLFDGITDNVVITEEGVSQRVTNRGLKQAQAELLEALNSLNGTVNVNLAEAKTYTDDEKARAVAEETRISNSLVAETNRATDAESILQSQINAVGVGNKAYKTYAEMVADAANITAKSKITVTNDSDTTRNGDYQYDGTSFTKSVYDVLTLAKQDADLNYGSTKLRTKAISAELEVNEADYGVENPSANASTQKNGTLNGTKTVMFNTDFVINEDGYLTSVSFIRYSTTINKSTLVFLSPTLASNQFKVEEYVEIKSVGERYTFNDLELDTPFYVKKGWIVGFYTDGNVSDSIALTEDPLNKTSFRSLGATTLEKNAVLSLNASPYNYRQQIKMTVISATKMKSVQSSIDRLNTNLDIQSKLAKDYSVYEATPLNKIALKSLKNKLSKFVYMGTSIANNTNSSVNKFAVSLQREFGSALGSWVCAGSLGGAVTGAYQDWLRQDFGGTKFLRLNGKNTSKAFTVKTYGNKLKIYYSKEVDGSTFNVVIDGVTTHTINCNGSEQSYRNVLDLTLSSGAHTVTFNPPASGDVYLESYEYYEESLGGLLRKDLTLGGSSLSNCFKRGVTTGNPNIPIVGNNGVDSFFDPEADLAFIEWHVNDSGTGGNWVSSGDYFNALKYLVDKYVAAKIPVILTTEMSGHYRTNANISNRDAYIKSKKDILRMQQAGVWVLDWDQAHRASVYDDLAHYCRTFYSTTYNDATDTFTGDFIHPSSVGYRALDDLLTEVTTVKVPHDLTVQKVMNHKFRYIPESTPKLIETEGKALPLESMGVRFLEVGVVNTPIYKDSTVTNIQTTFKESIRSSILEDDYGHYLQTGVAQGSLNSPYGFISYLATGTYHLVLKVSGNFTVRLDTSVGRILNLQDNVAPNITGLVENYLQVTGGSSENGEAPLTVCLKVQITTAGNLDIRFGRIYDICVVKNKTDDIFVVN